LVPSNDGRDGALQNGQVKLTGYLKLEAPVRDAYSNPIPLETCHIGSKHV
jgi:hypothetical protein